MNSLKWMIKRCVVELLEEMFYPIKKKKEEMF